MPYGYRLPGLSVLLLPCSIPHLVREIGPRDHQAVTASRRTVQAAGLALVLTTGCLMSACTGATIPAAPPSPWWATVQPPGATQASAFRDVPGSPADRCVRVGDHRDVRSGGFVAGNFAAGEQLFTAARQQAHQRGAVKIYWIPLHVGHMPELAVRATLLSGQAHVRAYQNQVAAGGGYVFYPSVVPIPVPGTWKLIATAGSNTGCFIVTFRTPAR